MARKFFAVGIRQPMILGAGTPPKRAYTGRVSGTRDQPSPLASPGTEWGHRVIKIGPPDVPPHLKEQFYIPNGNTAVNSYTNFELFPLWGIDRLLVQMVELAGSA